MEKFENYISIDKNINWMFDDIQESGFLEEFEYSDFRVIGGRLDTAKRKEYARDFSLNVKQNIVVYIEHKENKKIYKVRYIYRATFKSDSVKIQNVEEVSKEYLREEEEKDKDSAILKITDNNESFETEIYIKSISRDDEYEFFKYSYYLAFFDFEDEE